MPPKKKNPILRRFHGSVADTLLQLLPAVRLQREASCSPAASEPGAACPQVQDIMQLRTTARCCPAQDPEASRKQQALHTVHLVVVPTDGVRYGSFCILSSHFDLVSNSI